MATPIATVSALAAITLFMIASLLTVGQSMDSAPHIQIASVAAPAVHG